MKFRNGFVSNSSSSSFIIGLGKVTNLEKLQEFMAKGHSDIELNTVKSIKERLESKWHWREVTTADGKIWHECDYGNECVTYPLDELKDEDLIAIVDIHNNEGDDGENGVRSRSSYNEDPIEESYFNGTGQYEYLRLNEEEHGVSNYTCAYGCKRNG
jgi:hypothetical protein